MQRRTFLSHCGKAAMAGLLGKASTSARRLEALSHTPADHLLRIQPLTLELKKGVHVNTIAYNGSVPGPLLRLKQGVPVSIDVINESPEPEVVHWHGLMIDAENDGATEEGSPLIPPQTRLRYHFLPEPFGSRWYHTHTSAGTNLSRATYTGQFGFLYIEPKIDLGGYDNEVFLAIHHWQPSFFQMGPPMNALDVRYEYASFNDKVLGLADPIRVRYGQRVMFRFLNASATQRETIALPGHRFTVVAMDGNPVPEPRSVETLTLGVAERVDAIVEMSSPGKWILGSTDAKSRKAGLGIVVEYAGSTEPAVWEDPSSVDWDYLAFAENRIASEPEEKIAMTFAPVPPGPDKLQHWTINGKSYPDTPVIHVRNGQTYRLECMNSSAEIHPLHLHRHSFEVVEIGGRKCAGLIKDVVNIPPYSVLKANFTANNPGKTLFHCHQQLHMDFGFMQLIDYV